MGRTSTFTAVAGTIVLLAGCSSAKTTAALSPPVSAPAVTSPSASGSPADSASVSPSASPTDSVSASPSDSPTDAPTDLASMTGPQLVEAAGKAMVAAGSLKGTGSGSLLGGAPSKFTLLLSGTDSEMHLALGGAPTTLITTRTGTYINGPLALWTMEKVPPALAKKLAGKWIALPGTGGAMSGLTLASLAKELGKPTGGAKILDAVTKTTYQGKAVYVVKQDDGSLIDIAAEGAPLPLYVENHGKDKSTFTFTDYGKAVSIVAPKGAVDLATIAKA